MKLVKIIELAIFLNICFLNEVKNIQQQMQQEFIDLEQFVNNELKTLQEQIKNIEDKDIVLEQIKITLDKIVAYSKNKFKDFDIDDSFSNTLLDYIDEYFDMIVIGVVYLLENYMIKNPDGKITQLIKKFDILKYTKDVSLLKNIFDSIIDTDFKTRVEKLLQNIKQHFNQEMKKIEKEKETEIEFMQLGPIKSKIISLEQTLQTIQNDKITLEDQIAKFTNLKSRLNEL